MGIKGSEDTVVRPSQTFSSMDEAWSYALAHGANPFKNIRMYKSNPNSYEEDRDTSLHKTGNRGNA